MTPPRQKALVEMAFNHAEGTRRLRGLWALHAAGMLDESLSRADWQTTILYVRAWTIQLTCEDRQPSVATLAKFQDLAQRDPSPVVRLYLASAAGRLPADERWDIVGALARHAEDADDHNLPLMIWYAAEPLAEVNARRALALALDGRIPQVASFMARHVAAQVSPEALALVVDGSRRATTPRRRRHC